MEISKTIRVAAASLAIISGLGAASAAQAAYFVRPVLQYSGELEDGLSLNTLSNASATFNDGYTSLQSHVDLSAGTIKTYLEMYGPNSTFAGATGVMGDEIRYTGANDEAVSLRFDYDAMLSADQFFTGTPEEFDNRYIAVEAHFAIYEAGSGATWDDWTLFGTNSSKALFVDHDLTTFQDESGQFSSSYANGLGGDFFLTSGKSYEIFAAFNLIAVPGAMEGPITMNALNTSTISIQAQNGSFTSQSGEFLGFAQTPVSAVPEPSTWAMMIMGVGFVGAAMRRRKIAGLAL